MIIGVPKEIKNRDGLTIGTAVGLNTRKAIASQLNLLGRNNADALDAAIVERTDLAFRHVKSEIAGLNGDWTLHKVANRELASGVRQITVVVREVNRRKGPTDEAIAEAMGMSVEQVKEARARQMKALEVTEVETAEEKAPEPKAPEPKAPEPKVRLVKPKAAVKPTA